MNAYSRLIVLACGFSASLAWSQVAYDLPRLEALARESSRALLAARDGGLRSLVTPGTAAMIGRGAVMFFAYAGYCLALPALPIATTVALYFSAPLFITILSFFWLGDPVGWRR